MLKKKTQKKKKQKKKKKKPVRVQDLGLHITVSMSWLCALGPFEGIRICASSMDENLFTRHGVQHMRLRSEGFLRELDFRAEKRDKHARGLAATISKFEKLAGISSIV